MQRYCHEAKVRLEAFLGEHFVNDAFLRQFDKYKERVTLDHYMEALRRAEKQVPAGLNGPKKPQKRSSGPIMKRGSPKQASKRVSAHRGANNAVNKGQASSGANNAVNKGQAASSSTSSNVHDGADQQQQKKQLVLSMMKPPGQIPPLLTSRAPIERQKLHGTPAELLGTIQTFFTGRYQGNPAELANPLSKFLINEARMRRELANSSGSIDEISRAYNMLAGFYDMENVKVLEEEEGEEHEEMGQ